MNKCEGLIGIISADTCLKMDYFGSKFQKSLSVEGLSPPDIRFSIWAKHFLPPPPELSFAPV